MKGKCYKWVYRKCFLWFLFEISFFIRAVEITSVLAPLKHILISNFKTDVMTWPWAQKIISCSSTAILSFFIMCVNREANNPASCLVPIGFFFIFAPLLVKLSYLHSQCVALYNSMQLRLGNHRCTRVLYWKVSLQWILDLNFVCAVLLNHNL